MAPKTRGAARPSSSRAKEQRKKSSQPVLPATPRTPGKASMISRNVDFGRVIDFDFLEAEGFIIGNRIKSLGWGFLCKTQVPVYVDLVREFYQNATFEEEEIISSVRDIEIRLNEDVLGQVLRVPVEGVLEDSVEERGSRLGFLLNRDVVGDFVKVEARDFDVETRLLHHIVSRIILPRGGRFDLVTNRDVAVMCHILREVPISLPQLILSVMKDVVNRKAPLPYGMILTHVFRAFGLRLRDETAKSLGHFDIYNVHSLHRMGFNKVNGVWTRIRGGRPQDDVEEPLEGEEPSTPVVEAAAAPDVEAPVPSDSPIRQRTPARQRFDFSAEGTSSAPPPARAVFTRLHPEDISAIARELAQHLQLPSHFPQSTSASDASSLVPHHSVLLQMISDVLEEVRAVRTDVFRLTGRQLDFEQRIMAMERSFSSFSERLSGSVAGMPSGSEVPSSMADLTAEAGRLRGLLQTSSVALGMLSAEMDRKFACVDVSFFSLRKNIDALGTRLDRLVSLFPQPDPVSVRPPSQTTFSPVHLSSYRASQAQTGPPSRTRATSAKRKATSSSEPMTIGDSSDSDAS